MTMTPASALAFFASVIKSGEPWTPICQQAMDEAMAHMLRQANLTGGIPMTIPQSVKDAVKFANAECGKSSDFTFDMSGADWQTIHAHLLSQDAEIDRLQSRLAAADALLREISDRTATGTDFRDLAVRIRAHLSENTHDRA